VIGRTLKLGLLFGAAALLIREALVYALAVYFLIFN
jgi:hypothetical protein